MTAVELEHWHRFKFSEIAQSIMERVDDPSSAGVDKYVGLEHLDPESTFIRRWGVPEDVESTKLRFYPGDVIYGRRRAYQRKLGVAAFDGICSAHALVLRARPEVCVPGFLPYFLQSDAFHQRALDISVGSLSPTINWKTLAIQEFALPPIDEQRWIVEVLEEADQVRESYRCAETAAGSYWLAVAKTHLVAEAAVPLETIAEVELGKKRDPKLLIDGTPTPYLRAANVKFGHFELDDVLDMNFTEPEIERFRLEIGDVLVTEGCGSIAEVGACATWNGDLPGSVCFQMTLLRLRARDPSLARLLHHWAAFSFRSGAFVGVASGTSVFHLSAARVRKMQFPDLPDSARHQVVVELEAAQKLEHTASVARRSAGLLAASLRETLLKGSLDV